MTDTETMLLSIVIPAYNEAESLPELHREIVSVCETGFDGPVPYEILLVDDGSTDGTEAVCRGLHPLKVLRSKENRGQTAALDAGFHAARGRYIAALDADGQNDPAEIPAMLRYLEEQQLDAVCGWRKDRQDPLGKRFLSRGAWLLRQLVLHDGIHDSGCTLKVFRRECFENLHLTRGQHRFIPALLQMRGFSVGELSVRHRPRTAGKSKYRFTRVFRGLFDMAKIRAEIARRKRQAKRDREAAA